MLIFWGARVLTMGEEAFKSEIGEGKKESYGGLHGIEGIGMGS